MTPAAGGGGEGASDGDVVLSADDPKRTGIGYGVNARRRSLGIISGGLGQLCVRFNFFMLALTCAVRVDANAFCVLTCIRSIPLVAKRLRNRLLVLAFEACISTILLHRPYYIVSASMY